jgi:hypothetical protein
MKSQSAQDAHMAVNAASNCSRFWRRVSAFCCGLFWMRKPANPNPEAGVCLEAPRALVVR